MKAEVAGDRGSVIDPTRATEVTEATRCREGSSRTAIDLFKLASLIRRWDHFIDLRLEFDEKRTYKEHTPLD